MAIPSSVAEAPPSIDVTIWPPAQQWGARAQPFTLADDVRRFRQQLGLPTDRPVIMSGHQAALWHPGILAKWLAIRAFAAARGWNSAWAVVDHDPEDFTVLRVPARDERGRLVAVNAPLAPRELAERARAGAAPCALPPFDVPAPNVPKGLTLLASVESARHALTVARSASRSAAEQVMHAVRALIGGAEGDANGQPHMVLASRLGATDLFASLVQRMAADPAACHDAYNAGLRAAPAEARLTPLGTDPVRGCELPLWALDDATGLRKRVWSADLTGHGGIQSARLLPRALMLSGVLRLGACEVFVHGLGGGASRVSGTDDRHAGYDRATESWMSAWLGRTLAPSVVVSATMRLPLLDGPPVTATDVACALASLHAAAHTPAMLGDEVGARRKTRALAEINGLPRGSAPRREAFVRMHADLAAVRAQRERALTQLNEQTRALVRRFEDQAVGLDRTWSFALFDAEARRRLESAVRTTMGLPSVPA